MLKIHFSKDSVTASPIREENDIWFKYKKKVISHGKAHNRITFDNKPNDQSLAIRTISKTILTEKPGFDLLNWLGIRRRVILEVKEGDKRGYIAVNAESLRKRLGETSRVFYHIVKQNNEEITAYVEQCLSLKSGSEIAEGCDYLYGRNGRQQDERKAFELFQTAAEKGLPLGYGNMAYCYSHGKGVEKSSENAKKSFESALGIMGAIDSDRYKEHFLKEYINLGVKEVEFFIDQYPSLQLQLGSAYFNGDYDFIVDEKKALEIFEKVAGKGKIEKWMYLALGKAFLEGTHGFIVDEKKALEYFQEGTGKIESGMYIAYCYSKGKGVERDSEQAKKAILQMIEMCKPRGSIIDDILIKCEELDIPEFTEVCNKNPNLYLEMGKNLISYKPSEYANKVKIEKIAFNFFKNVAELNIAEGYAWLSYCYRKGINVEKNNLEAIKMFSEGTKLAKTDEEAGKLISVFVGLGL